MEINHESQIKTCLPVILSMSNSITETTSLWSNNESIEAFLDFIERQWIHLVPEIYRPQSARLQQTFDEQRAFDELIQPLEWFITGSDQSRDMLLKLKNISKPPQLCGRVFKSGEPNYNCRDCSSDATCVLCVDCFKNSVHRRHRYKICHSNSGYCDCGDPEAWRCDPICSLHAQKTNKLESFESVLSTLMTVTEFQSITNRLRIVFRYILDYIYLMLKWNESHLPRRLHQSNGSGDDQFVSVLYNDETHTYEHVIFALTKSIKCDNKLATDYATAVDREGRCVICHGSYEKCQQVASQIGDTTRKNSEKVLEVKVLSTNLVAHQTFVTRLMSWAMELLPVCAQFRQVFADYLYQPNHRFWRFHFDESISSKMSSDLSLLEKIMRSDTWFWKSIRILWHQLFMSGLLLDIEPKKHFARLFTRNYTYLLRDYIQDDHEHRVSVLALAVQIYTVPSIAAMLIEQDNALAILLNSFLELNFPYHKSGRFKFENSSNTLPFKRSYAALLDLQYLLTKASDTVQWTDKMRTNFVHGAEAFIKLLKRMQNMDSIIRQVVQHIEYEPGWDTGMNFEIKMCPIIKMFIEWTITDKYVYLDVLNIGLRVTKDSFEYYANGANKQNQNPLTNSQCATIRRHYADKSAMVWDYNVDRKEVSIHVPLSRFISALLLHMPKYDIWHEYGDYSHIQSRLTAHRLNAESMMELALRTQVLLGQFRAGMWRRNGYSLINQIMFYQSPRLRETTYDLDILALQLGAAMLEPNEFMIHVMYKYNVDGMLDGRDQLPNKRNDDSTRHQITLLEEFFRLIYTILVERYTVGLGAVTEDDCRKNEIIQWLCKESMSNSDLLAHLSNEDGDKNIEDLILQVAEFRRSSSSSNTAGRYVLMEVNYERFNPFFYHYTRQDQSAAFESQMRRKRDHKGKYCCCPPPPLPDFIESFQSINQILVCDVTLTIIKCVLEKTINLKDIYFSDFQFQQCLYLIGIALNEELKHPDKFKFSERAIDFGIVSLLEQCSSRHIMTRVEMHQGLYDWVLDRFKQVMLKSNSWTSTDNDRSCIINQNANSGASVLEDQEQERNRRRKMAAARKERILQQMQQQQRTFMKENEKYFKENLPNQTSKDVSMLDLSNSTSESDLIQQDDFVAFGAKRTPKHGSLSGSEVYTCILCLESQDVNANNGRYLLLAGFIQRSTVLSKNRSIQSWKSADDINCLLPRSDHNFGPFINTCTHYMHNDCFDKYIETSAANERRRSAHRYLRITFDLSKREFLCPLCECLSNLTIPIMPTLQRPVDPSTLDTDISMDQWLNAMLNILQGCNTTNIWINQVDALAKVSGFSKCFSTSMESLPEDLRIKLSDICKEYNSNRQPSIDSNDSFRDTRNKIVDLFCETIHKVTKAESESMSTRNPHDLIQCINWSISFTIQVMERSMHLDQSSLSELVDTRQYQCLKALISFVRAQLNFYSPVYPRRIFMYLMNYLLVNTVYQSSPYHLLDVDAFTLLVSLMSTAPSFFDDQISRPDDSKLLGTPLVASNHESFHSEHFIMPLGNTFDKNLIELMLTCYIVQIILTNADLSDIVEEPMDIDESNSGQNDDIDSVDNQTDNSSSAHSNTALMVASFCKDILIAAGHKFSEEKLMTRALKITEFIKHNSLSFLRSTALFAFFLTEIRWPKRLWLKSKNAKIAPLEEYELLCRYLAIESDLASLIHSINLKHLCLSWTRHQKLSTLFVSIDPTGSEARTVLDPSNEYLRQPHLINRLVSLPYDFSDLINSVANFTCPTSNGEESRSPTMCLICGEILCSQNYCCQRRVRKELVGACTYHSQQCSASVGIFLRIRDNKILLLTSRGRGCYLPSPYVDKYGETDSGLCRGHPMFLSESAYEQLYRLWFRHGIPEQIVHLMETSNSLASTNWNIM